MPNQFDGPSTGVRAAAQAARRSLERTGGELSGSVSLSQPGDAERKAIIGLTGQYRPADATRIAVRLADLDRAVRESTGRGLPELLAELGEPLRDRRAERDVRRERVTPRSARRRELPVLVRWYWDGLARSAGTGR